tara:strand:+ start:1670 stop:1891 length:222 start_codon:yes stop_codon:yes gene_type:complete
MKPIRITFYHYHLVEMIAEGIYYNKGIKRISKKQCKEWIKGSLSCFGSGGAKDFNFSDEDYKLAEQLIKKYNL